MTSTPPGNSARPHRARRGEGELLRDELMDAAEALLVEHGHPDRVSMRAVATRVGVTPAAIYNHFEDKDELFYATCERRFTELSEQALAAMAGATDAPARLRAMGAAYVRWGLAHREHYAVLLGGSVAPPAGVDVTTLTGRGAATALLAVVRQGQDDRELRRDISAEDAATFLWSCVHGYVSLVTSKQPFVPEFDLPGAEPAVLEAAVGSLVPPPSGDA